MPKHYSLDYKKLRALEDERKLMVLDATTAIKDRANYDPTSEIPGTGPEKLVYNYLVKLGVKFEFQYHMQDLPSTAFPEDVWIPDFILPDYNIMIEVYGAYWHSLPQRREGDQLKKVYWLQSGYTVYESGIPMQPTGGPGIGKAVIWWDWEIYLNLDQLFSRDLPEIFETRIQGEPEEFLQDAKKERLAMAGRIAAMKRAKLRPRINPMDKRIRKLRRKLFDINSLVNYG